MITVLTKIGIIILSLVVGPGAIGLIAAVISKNAWVGAFVAITCTVAVIWMGIDIYQILRNLI